MRGVNASTVVAAVTDASAVCSRHLGDRAEMQFVTDAVSGTFEVRANRHNAIARIAGRQRPVPAIIGVSFVNTSPKALRQELLCDRLATSDATAFRGAEPLASLCCGSVSGCCLELRPADAARHSDGGTGWKAATRQRAEPRFSTSFSEDGAADSARHIAVFYRWCHRHTVTFASGVVNIAGLMAGGAATGAASGNSGKGDE